MVLASANGPATLTTRNGCPQTYSTYSKVSGLPKTFFAHGYSVRNVLEFRNKSYPAHSIIPKLHGVPCKVETGKTPQGRHGVTAG